MAIEIINIDNGRQVVCDICGADWTDRPESGGIYGLGTKGICPDCTPRVLASCERYGELEHIKARCPPGKSFGDWIREDIR